MSDGNTAYVPMTDAQRTEAVWKLWDALANRLLESLQGDKPPRASMLHVARQFLSSQGIDARAVPELRRGLKALTELRDLPFNDKGEPN
jgi:hypothetical protein